MRTKVVKNRKVDSLMYINKASILRQLSKNAQLNAAHLYAKFPLLFWLRNGNSCNIEKIPKPVRGRDANGCLPFTKIFQEIRSKVNGARLFGSSQRKIFGSNGTCEKVVLFFRMEYFNRKLVIHFFKVMFNTSFRPSLPFSGKWNWFVQMVNAIPIPGRNLRSWTLRTIYPNRKPKVLLFIIVLEFPRLIFIRHYAKEKLTRVKAPGKKLHSDH